MPLCPGHSLEGSPVAWCPHCLGGRDYTFPIGLGRSAPRTQSLNNQDIYHAPLPLSPGLREGRQEEASGCAPVAPMERGRKWSGARCTGRCVHKAPGRPQVSWETRRRSGKQGAGRGRGGQRRAGVGPPAAPAHLPAGAGRGAALGRARLPPPSSRLPPGEEAEGRGVNRAAAVMSAGHMEPLMARDGSRRAGSCGSCCCGSGGGGAAAAEGAPGSDHPLSLRSPHRGVNDVFCDRSDESSN